MSDNMKKILLVGTGPMAVDYAKVLQALQCEIVVIGRGETSAQKFREQTGLTVVVGGLEEYLRGHHLSGNPEVIIATGTESLMKALLLVLKSDVGNVLVEKPAAISIEELLKNENQLRRYADKIFVAYNRRFYDSVMEAERMIQEDGGLQSMHFEFTEWAHKIEPLQKYPGVKENWFFANSTHVVDLAFFLAGLPKDWKSFSKSGTLSWHTKTNFAGAGVTEKGVLFSYLSNWESAGRWSIELLTGKRRLYLKPLEEVKVQLKGSVELVEVPTTSHDGNNFKPGLYGQVQAFLQVDRKRLVGLSQHIQNAERVYSRMLNL